MVNSAKRAFLKILIVLVFSCFGTTCSSTESSTTSTGCSTGTQIKEIVINGEIRQYRLHVPTSYKKDTPTPLVLGFHGNTGRAEQFETLSGFSTLADHEGFIIAYPQGAGEQYSSWETWEGSKDVQFIYELIKSLEDTCNIDTSHVYAVGFSLGGGMANRLACDLSNEITAIGTVSGAYQNPDPCSPSQPVAVIAVHGTADTNVYYNGTPPNGQVPGAYYAIGVPIPQWASTWARRNGCDMKPLDTNQKDSISTRKWKNCQGDAEVVLYTIKGGEHTWPSLIAGFSTEELIWDFLALHSRTPATDK